MRFNKLSRQKIKSRKNPSRGSKKLVSALLILALLLSSGCFIYAKENPARPTVIYDIETGESLKDIAKVDKKWKDSGDSIPANATGFKVDGKSSILMSAVDGKVLYENNPDEKLPIASVTKIMTMLLIMESIESGFLTYETSLTASAHAESMGGSQIWLEEGEQMNVRDLLKAVAIVSANDACVVFAEAISGNHQEFVVKMNQRAGQLGMTNTLFKDSNGLDDEGYSTARDIAIMSKALLKHSAIKEFTTTWMDVLRGGESQLVNTNKLIRFYEGATGLKTGTTSKSGHCLSATAQRNGLELIAVVLGCDSTDKRFASTRQMLDYGFANYSIHKPNIDLTKLKNIKVKNGTADLVATKLNETTPFLISRGKESGITENWMFPEFLNAPITEGQVVGKIVFEYEGDTLAEYDIYAGASVPKLNFGRALLKLLEKLVR